MDANEVGCRSGIEGLTFSSSLTSDWPVLATLGPSVGSIDFNANSSNSTRSMRPWPYL